MALIELGPTLADGGDVRIGEDDGHRRAAGETPWEAVTGVVASDAALLGGDL